MSERARREPDEQRGGKNHCLADYFAPASISTQAL